MVGAQAADDEQEDRRLGARRGGRRRGGIGSTIVGAKVTRPNHTSMPSSAAMTPARG
ncbi:MAG: hypothetical protein IPI35_25340 [Deltaproteobacteria bacterium]|nr:hypothetical protein [Deltaproteobacteria bacterium]